MKKSDEEDLTFLTRHRSPSSSLLDGAQRIDVMKGLILVTVVFTVQNIDTSVIYHVVRVQSVSKSIIIICHITNP